VTNFDPVFPRRLLQPEKIGYMQNVAYLDDNLVLPAFALVVLLVLVVSVAVVPVLIVVVAHAR
jgi:hypothetical protein